MSTVMKTTQRLNETETEFAARLRRDNTTEAAAAAEILGIGSLRHASPTALVHTLIEAGIAAIRARAEEISQRRLADYLASDQEHIEWMESRRARRMRAVE